MIKSLYLRDFRNYKEAKVSFSPKTNVIWGDNAQGKTNLLEALYLFITGRSFRTHHLSELISFGAKNFYLEMLFEKNGIEQTLKFSFDGSERKILHNATSLSSLSTLLGILNGVVLSPEDRTLIKGGPTQRRQFLDLLLSQAKPLYLHHLSRYLRAMKQRNFLLKTRSLKTLSVWEEQMAQAGSFLTQMRFQTVNELASLFQAQTIGSDHMELSYRSQAMHAVGLDSDQLTAFFLKQFNKNVKRECDLGVTLVGPHRDDLTITIEGKEARQFGSEGQQRSCVASLKLAQWKWLKLFADHAPIFCIDDLGVSFDSSRENALFKRIEELAQVFITSARPIQLLSSAIHVHNGNFYAKSQ